MQTKFLDLNLLPKQQSRQRPTGRSAWLGWLLLAFAVATLIPLWQLKSMGDSRVRDIQTKLDYVREQVRHVDDLLAEKELLGRSLQDTKRQTDRLERERAILQNRQSHVSGFTTSILQALPPRTRVEDITQDGATLKIRGWAGSASLALSYARALQDLGQFRTVNITTLDRRTSDPVPTAVTFVIELEE